MKAWKFCFRSTMPQLASARVDCHRGDIVALMVGDFFRSSGPDPWPTQGPYPYSSSAKVTVDHSTAAKAVYPPTCLGAVPGVFI